VPVDDAVHDPAQQHLPVGRFAGTGVDRDAHGR